ncbi:glycosyltransferase family 4 protein [Comamonas antarctica]|uniref:Glycosyltransferase family 4 protein n=1 Tax=Comamonas antarctica TaxID=2743470 RepID=A0A6N1X6W1_9BURK|nr:glycosyltransferase family 1 protein [Comamonas antarctica]QKV55114.1 glycosyltransferase family 4 protein [Comamonas antarctica]
MKLVLSVEALSPHLTGIGRYTWELAQRLPMKGQLQEMRFYHGGRWIDEPARLLKTPASASTKKKPLVSVKPPRWLRDWRNSAICRDRLFHGPNFFLPACAEAGVATVHDLSVFKYPETHPIERIRHFERDFKASMARASHLITDSEATRREVMEFLGWPAEKITAVHLGVSPQFAPASEVELEPCLSRYGLGFKRYALCVSTLEPRKKIANLLQAYESLPAAVREQYPLVLVGGAGWLSDGLHATIERLAAQGWLRYLGFVPEADLPALYAGAQAFVYPSIYEGFGLPVLEAMASGVPVVTSIFTSLPEVTQGAARLVDSDDIDALSLGIHASLCDEGWRAAARETGLAKARNFTWSRCVDRTIDVYRQVAGKSS